MVKNIFSEPKNQRKNISRLIYFIKISTQRFVGLVRTNKLERFFFEKFFCKELELFLRLQHD